MGLNDSTLHLNVPLTNLAVGYRPDHKKFLWNKLMPPMVVPNTSNIIRQIDRANLMTLPDIRSGAQGFMTEVALKMGADLNYRCIDYACEVVRDRRERANADIAIQYDEEMLFTGLTKVHGVCEKVVFTTLRDTANYAASNTVTLTGGDRWDQPKSPDSDPLGDILTGIELVLNQVGGGSGTVRVTMHALVWNQIKQHPNVLSRAPVHPTGGGIMTVAMFEEIIFGKKGDVNAIDGEVIITRNFFNTANEGAAESMSSFVGPDVLITYSEAPGLRSFGYGTAFMFAGTEEGIDFLDKSNPGGGVPLVVYSYPDPKRGVLGSDVDRIVGSVDFKVLNNKAGFLIKTVVDATNTALYGSFLSF